MNRSNGPSGSATRGGKGSPETQILEMADLLPKFDFAEIHERWIDAPPPIVWERLATMSLDELAVTRLLLRIRHPFGRTRAKT